DDLLKRLNNAAIPWGIVTNKPIAYAQPLIEKLQLSDSCDVLICPDHVAQVKPHPEGLFMAAKKINCHASTVAYIGDHDRDIEAGRAAGMKTIAAAYGYIGETQNVEDWHADSIAKHPQDIHSTLERLFSCTI
ncbi:MAG: HAD-IA family hydrolase, partial [Pseudomonadales bacterium]